MIRQRPSPRGLPVLAALLIVFAANAASAATQPYKGFERAEALITAPGLKALIDAGDPDLVIIAVAKAVDYRLGHIPGALSVWRGDYGAPAGGEYPYGGMVAQRRDFQAFARALGISRTSKVVVYDHKYDATRLWWAFFLYGKADVQVLDGGYEAWRAAGYDSDTLAPDAPGPGDFTAAEARGDWSVDDAYIREGSSALQLWDARDVEEWSGETVRSGAYRAGRIPNATLVNWREFRRPDGEFLNAGQMTAMLDDFGFDDSKEQVFYCQSGVRATQDIFGLYLLGWDVAKLHNFDGSWIAWSFNAQNPVVCDRCQTP